MFTTRTAHDLHQLILSLDGALSLERKFALLHQWFLRLPGVEAFRFLDFDHPDEDLTDEDRTFSPDGPVVLTPESPLPPFFQARPEWSEGSLYYPLPPDEGRIRGVFLLKTSDPSSLLTDQGPDLGIAASKWRDILSLDRIRPRDRVVDQVLLGDRAHRNLLETLNLPLYLMDLSGQFRFANAAFLRHFGYDSWEAVDALPGGFFDPVERAEILRTLVKAGSTDGLPVTVVHSSGRQVAARDYGVLRDGLILGVLFDVTDFVSLNQEMKQALEIQELLNNKILSNALILQKTQTTSIRALARLAEYRDQETGNHLQRICEYTGILTREVYKRQPYDFQISEQYVEDMVLSSMLHDIGKVAVPDSILRKKNDLTAEEWDVMKRHTHWGWQILHQADKELGEQSFLTLASQIAQSHHEKWDGTGYPDGLTGDKIPLSARLEAVADVYDALTSVRPYKHAWTHEEALEEIQALRGVHFDPVLVDLLLDVEDQFREVKDRYAGETP